MTSAATNKNCPAYGYLKNPSLVDFPGRLAAVFFTSGCNFRCGFCHNAGLMSEFREGIPWEQLKGVCSAFQRDWVAACVVTGGEPTLHPDLPGLLRHFKSIGWAIKLDTNGSLPDRLEKILPLVDYVAMDVKAGPSGYPALAGYDNLDNIRQSIRLIREHARDYELRTTIIEHIHTPDEMTALGEMIRSAKRYVLQPFLPRDDLPSPALRTTPRTRPQTMAHLQKLMQPYAAEILLRSG